eukprot:gene22601-biopygen20755
MAPPSALIDVFIEDVDVVCVYMRDCVKHVHVRGVITTELWKFCQHENTVFWHGRGGVLARAWCKRGQRRGVSRDKALDITSTHRPRDLDAT